MCCICVLWRHTREAVAFCVQHQTNQPTLGRSIWFFLSFSHSIDLSWQCHRYMAYAWSAPVLNLPCWLHIRTCVYMISQPVGQSATFATNYKIIRIFFVRSLCMSLCLSVSLSFSHALALWLRTMTIPQAISLTSASYSKSSSCVCVISDVFEKNSKFFDSPLTLFSIFFFFSRFIHLVFSVHAFIHMVIYLLFISNGLQQSVSRFPTMCVYFVRVRLLNVNIYGMSKQMHTLKKQQHWYNVVICLIFCRMSH